MQRHFSWVGRELAAKRGAESYEGVGRTNNGSVIVEKGANRCFRGRTKSVPFQDQASFPPDGLMPFLHPPITFVTAYQLV